jgi:hypothetical protein
MKVSLGTSIFPSQFGGLVPGGWSSAWTSKLGQNDVFFSKHVFGHIFIPLPVTNTRGSGHQTQMHAYWYQGAPTTLMVRQTSHGKVVGWVHGMGPPYLIW